MTILISITEPDGTIHPIERRAADMGLLYTPEEQALLATGRTVRRWTDAGLEEHVDVERLAERLSAERGTESLWAIIRRNDPVAILAGALALVWAVWTLFAWVLA